MGYYEDFLEDRKKKKAGLSEDKSGTDDKYYQNFLEDRKKLGFETPKPSQVAKEEITPSKTEEKKPSWFEQVKTKATDFFSSLSGKKKIEEQLSKTPTIEAPKIDVTQIQPKQDYGLKLYDVASGKTAEESAKSTGIKQTGKWGEITPPQIMEAVPSMVAGAGDVITSTGNVLKWKGIDGLGDKLVKKGGELRQFMPDTSDIGEFDWKDLMNPRLYTTMVARGSVFTLAMMPLAIAGGYAGAAVAGAAGLGLLGTTILAAIGGSALTTPFESASEAGNTYDEMLAEGKTREEADKAANKTFKGNLLLLGLSNTLQYIPILGQLGKTADTVSDVSKTVSRTSKIIKGATTAAGEFVSEGGEEVAQKNISLWSKDKPFDITSNETLMEFTLGGIQGLVFTAGGAIIDSSTGKDVTAQVTQNGIERAKQTVDEIKDRVITEVDGTQDKVNELVNEGNDIEVAKEMAVEEAIKKDKKTVDKIIKEVLVQKTEEDGEVVKQTDVQPLPVEQGGNIEEKDKDLGTEKAPEVLEQTKMEEVVTEQVETEKQPEHITKGIELSKKLTDQQVFDKAVEELGGYIKRNETAEEFIDDVNTLGHTFGEFEGDLNVKKDKVTIELADGRIFKFNTKDIFDTGKSKTPKIIEKENTEQLNIEELPPEIQTKAEEDWTDNYAEDYGRMENLQQELNKQIKEAKGEEKTKLEARRNEILRRQGEMENEFINKYKPVETITARNLAKKMGIEVVDVNLNDESDIETGTPQEAKEEFLETMKTQLRRAGMEDQISIYEGGKFSYKTVDSSELDKEQIDNPELVKEYEKKIKNGERPRVLIRQQAGETWISDGNHKLKAYRNLGIKDIPVIEVVMPESDIKKYDQVTFTKNKKELTGRVISVDRENKTVSVDVNEVSTYGGGIPIGRIETVSIDNISDIVKSDIIETDETTTIQPNRVPDTSEVRQPDDRERNPEIDERTLHDETTGVSESGNGLKRTGTTGGKVTRAEANNVAESILQAHDFSTDRKDYTQEELDQLALYSGAGGKAEAGATGKGLLSEYYTPQEVKDKVWEIVDKLTPIIINSSDLNTYTKALEPSIGIGSLLGGMRNGFKFEAYEYQKVSGTIAKLLNPDIDVHIGNGEEFGNEGNFENHQPKADKDLVIGNPPFGERASFLKGKGVEPKINRWEEFFIKRGLDSLREGGYLVYVVNSSFLNKGNTTGKEEISKIGKLVQAFRLPEGIFADTTIGTDIVVFEKTNPLTGKDSFERFELQKRTTDISDNNYFSKNFDNIAGTLETRKDRFGKEEQYVKGTLEDVKKLPTILEQPETKETEQVISNEPTNNKYFINVRQEDGSLKFIETSGKKVEVKHIVDAFIHKDIEKREDKMNWVVSEGKTGMVIARDTTQQTAIEKANRLTDTAGETRVAEHIVKSITENGVSPRYSGKPTPAIKDIKEPSYSIKVKREITRQTKKEILPAIIKPDKAKVETVPVQTVSGGVSNIDPVESKVLKETKVDGSVDYIAEAKKYLNYNNGKYYHDINYFSGDIYQKLEELKSDKNEIINSLGQAQYDKQLKGLEAVKPKPVTLNDITFDPLDRYINEVVVDEESGIKLLNQFVEFLNKTDSALSYGVSRWDVRNYVMGYRASPGTKNIMGAIKSDSARLFNYFVRNVLPSEIQNQIVDKFNREKNSYVNPDYSRIPTEIKDMAKFFRGKTFKLSPTQSNGVSFLTNKGVGLIAYGVGVGKTHTLLTATMVAKQKGWTKRPVFIVPKSTLSQTWISTIKSMFPNETIINLGGLNKPDVTRLEKERGKDKTKWIKDGEVAVLTHEGLLRLSLTPDEMNEAVGDLTDALSSETATARQEEIQKSKIQEIVGKAQYKAGDINITDLGIDHISVDEVHNFRKIFQGAKPEAVLPDGTVDKSKTKRFANVIGGTPSKQAQQLFLISQHILKKNNNRGVFLASATPFENHATEVYNILSLVARDRLKKIGIFNINDFFALFSNFETELEKNVRGEWVNKEKMKSFKNLPQLQKILREFVDYQTDPTLVRPERKVLTPTLQMSQLQLDNLNKIQEMLKPDDGRKPEDGAVLKASTYSVANSISPYFIKEYQPQIVTPEELVDNSPKLKYSMELIKWLKGNEATKRYGTFMYLGSNGVEYHNHLAEYVVKHLGFKDSEVAVINGATSNDEREAIKQEFNDGKVKVLIGGDPTKEGIDLQNNGYVTINVALGWNPTEPAQVEGRVWRQGNKRNIAPLIYPLVENSGDVTVYNKFEEKGSRINDLFSYQGQIFDVGELDPREKKLALMTNPEDKAAIEIEMDKAGLQNQLMVYNTDIGNYKRIKDSVERLTDRIKFNEERITTGKTQWGSPIDKEGISNYRKELTKSKNELKNIQEKLDKNNITDIDGEIAKIETLKEQLNIELGKISETYKDRLAKFQREYDDMIANRKSISGHVNDFIEATKDLKELSDEEVATKKEQLIKELEAKQIKDASFEYKAPSGNADIGGYADLEASGIVVDHIRTIQFPEMVSMVRELTGDVPTLKRFKRALGRMYESGKGYIKLNPDIFNNPVQAAKTLAHEIGHLADFIPDGFTSRGNLIGRIASLSKFMQGKYGDLNNREIKQELKNLTQLWKPFDETVNENFTKYRYSSKELYADAVSVLLNDPGLLQKVAPKFYDGFFEYINSKPELEKVYFDTLEMLDKGEEAINNKRLEEIYEGFREARQKREEIESTEKPKKPFWERVMRNHITKFDPIYRKLSKVDIGVVESSKQKMREALEIYQMRRNDQAVFLDKVTTEITDALDKIGMTEDDLGVVLKLEREALGDRINLANPGGLIGNIPEVTLEYFYKQKNLTDEQIKVFEQIKTRFHELIFSETERAVNNGNFNKEVFEEKIVPNKDTYATFSVVDYIHKNYISAGIKQQTGTLKRIENPFTSSILKTVALIDWNNVQEAKQIAVGELQQYFPDDVKPAKATRTNKGSVIRFKAEDNMEVLEMMENGRRIGFNVDPYIKSMFENENFTADEVHQLVGISRAFNKLFKPLVTTYNLSWGFFSNIIRDFKRTYISLGASLNKFAPDKKNISIGEMLVSYIKSIPQGAKFAAGKRTELITEMLKNKAITTTWSQYDPNANNDTSIAFLLRQHKLLGKEEKVGAVRKLINNSVGKLLDGIKYAGGVFEATSKISGYQLAKKRVSDGKRLGFITRNYVGTPNYTEGGTWKQMDNDIFVFSNVMIQATRASVELAVDPKTASGYWMRIFIVGVLPKLLMVAGLAGLFGEWVKKNFQSQTEYDKTNYITMPVGFDENGKAVYIRIPQDETERFVSAIVWKTLSSIAQKKIVKPQQIGAIGAGYIPSVTPLWTALGDWVGYLQGRNPYDNYRGRLAIDETAWKAGGLIRLGKMVQYSANTLGLSNFKTYDSGNRSTTEVILDRIPVINRMFQTSNYGLQEKFDSSAEQESAKKSIKKRDIVDKYVKLSRGIEDPEELSKLRTDMVKEYFGGELPTNKDLINEGKQLAKKFTIQRERGSSPYMDKLIYSNLNAEKLDYLKQFQKDMSVADFKNLVNDALKYKIISEDVVNELKILDKQSGYEEKKQSSFNFKLVKDAFAAENINETASKMTWTKDIRTGWEKFLGKVADIIPGEQKYENLKNPIEGIAADKLNSDQKREYYQAMLKIREEDPDWYYQNIGNKVEKRILGFDLGKESDVRKSIKDRSMTQQEIINKQENKPGEPTPTPGKTRKKTLDDGTEVTIYETPHDDIIDKEFGDVSDEARRVLKWDEGKGENPGYKTGEGWVDEKTGEHGDYNYKTEKKIVDGKTRYFYILDKDGNKIKRWVDKTNGKDTTEDNPNAVVNEDRGLFRINSGSFYDLMKRKKKEMEELGITSYDDMYDVSKNIAVAKIIYKEGGWKRWYGAAPELIN